MTSVERGGLEAIRRVVGDQRAGRISYVYRDRVQPASDMFSYLVDPRGRRSRQRLDEMRDAHVGERCFIIGNGPSIGGMDLSVLRDEFTFGLNRGYLLFDRIGAPTTFLVAVNRYVVEQFARDLIDAGSTTFISWRSRRWIPAESGVTFIRRSRLFTFSTDITKGAWEGATVTFVALQLAFHMGFEQVILIGVDHSFATSGPANRLVMANEPDPNHFDPTYFGPGVKWQLPDLKTSEIAYQLAHDAYVAAGRAVIDATIGGNLTVFPKARFEQLTRTAATR